MFTELMFKALQLPSVTEFIENLVTTLRLEKLSILVMRLPARRSKTEFVKREGKAYIVKEELHGAAVKKRDVILVWPDLLWLNKKAKPSWRMGIRGFILNSTIRAVIHEMLHESGVKDEDKVRDLTDQHYKRFRRLYLNRFEMESKPVLREWKRIEKKKGPFVKSVKLTSKFHREAETL